MSSEPSALYARPGVRSPIENRLIGFFTSWKFVPYIVIDQKPFLSVGGISSLSK